MVKNSAKVTLFACSESQRIDLDDAEISDNFFSVFLIVVDN